MYKILITTHGRLCEGLRDTISLFTDDISRITTIPFYTEECNGDEILLSYMKDLKNDDTLVVFTDIVGGSVNQKLLSYRSEQVHLITGVNLPSVLEFLYLDEEKITTEFIKSKISDLQTMLIYMNEVESQSVEGDE